MWNYTETDAYDSISLHDCRTNNINIIGNDLVISFPDGFWITPASKHIDHERPLKTGPSQLRFIGLDEGSGLVSVDLYKNIRLFRKTVFCRRTQPEIAGFLRYINDGRHELEFLYEYHNSVSALYKCWIWKKQRGMEAECELELTAKSIVYYWNEILTDRAW